MQTFFKMGNFKLPFLTHRRKQSHQIFTVAKQMGVLVDYQVLSRSLYNWGRYCALNFKKSQKNVKVWGALTRVRGGNSKICSMQNF